jgi:hypothetical protein
MVSILVANLRDASPSFQHTAASEPVSSSHKEQHPIRVLKDIPFLVLRASVRPTVIGNYAAAIPFLPWCADSFSHSCLTAAK